MWISTTSVWFKVGPSYFNESTPMDSTLVCRSKQSEEIKHTPTNVLQISCSLSPFPKQQYTNHKWHFILCWWQSSSGGLKHTSMMYPGSIQLVYHFIEQTGFLYSWEYLEPPLYTYQRMTISFFLNNRPTEMSHTINTSFRTRCGFFLTYSELYNQHHKLTSACFLCPINMLL